MEQAEPVQLRLLLGKEPKLGGFCRIVSLQMRQGRLREQHLPGTAPLAEQRGADWRTRRQKQPLKRRVQMPPESRKEQRSGRDRKIARLIWD